MSRPSFHGLHMTDILNDRIRISLSQSILQCPRKPLIPSQLASGFLNQMVCIKVTQTFIHPEIQQSYLVKNENGDFDATNI